MWTRLGLNRRFLVLLILVAVPLISLAHLQTRRSLFLAREDLKDRTLRLTQLGAVAVDEHLAGLLRLVELHSRRSDLCQAALRRDAEAVRAVLAQMVESSRQFDHVFITDPTGIEWIGYPSRAEVIGTDCSSCDWYRSVRDTGAGCVSRSYRRAAASGELSIAAAVPVTDERGTLQGIVVAQSRMRSMSESLRRVAGNWSGSLALIDGEGQTCALAGDAWVSITPEAESAVTRWVTETEWVIGAAAVPSFKGIVVAEQPTEAALKPALGLARLVYALAFLLALVVALGAHAFIETRRRRFDVMSKTRAALQRARNELEVRVRERTAELSRLAAIVECSNDAIIGHTLQGRIVSWNPGAEGLYGYSAAEAIGRPVSMLSPADHPDETSKLMGSILRGERVEHFDLVRIRKDGRQIDVSLTLSPIKDPEGVISGVSEITRDITSHKQIDRMKDGFISVVSHELRTPLTSIHGSLLLMASGVGGALSGQSKSLVDIACRNSQRLARLINSVLDIGRIESGRLHIKPWDLKLLVEQAVQANLPYFEPLGVACVLEPVPPDVRVLVDGDRLIQVLTNLLSNAAKFSWPAGTVRVGVKRLHDGARIFVRNSGPGVPEAFRPRIFQKFAQADSSDGRQKEGTGLGLYIAKTIVEKFGGRMGYESVPDTSTTFYFDLPEWKAAGDSALQTTGAGASS